MYNYFSQHLDDGSVPFLSQPHSLLNRRYSILKPLGQGGFGKTFLALDHKHQVPTTEISGVEDSAPQVCVIKQLFPQHHTIDHYRKASKLFHQESLLLEKLGTHPQIPQLLEFFEQDGQHYIVQEWIDGQTLQQELAETGTFNEDDILQLLKMLLPVLQFVHEHQVIHRDIKPANIIRRRSDRQLVLVDFGAAKYTTTRIPEKTGTLIGSAEYAAPEQVRGKAVFASDLYSLGVTCLHLLTQMPPFDLYDCGDDIWTWRSYLTHPIHPSLAQILDKLLSKATRQRYQSAAAVLLDLRAFSKQKHQKIISQPIAITPKDNHDFETPYFGFSSQQNLPHSITVYSAELDLHSIAAVTVFDPETQDWYHLPPTMEVKEIVQKASVFLGSCLTNIAGVTPDWDSVYLFGSNNTSLHNRKTPWQMLGAIITYSVVCLALVYLYLGIQSQSSATARGQEISHSQELSGHVRQ